MKYTIQPDHGTRKLIIMGFIAGLCYSISLMVFNLIVERENTYNEARVDISNAWGKKQVVLGPILIIHLPDLEPLYILPDILEQSAFLKPEERSRGIFHTYVYRGQIHTRGTFSQKEIAPVFAHLKKGASASIAVVMADTRGIENQPELLWNEKTIPFEPGSGVDLLEGSGLHSFVHVSDIGKDDISFSFTLDIKGSEGISFSPLGRETLLTIFSPWETPKFTGPFLPSSRDVGENGFRATWKISSFGRSYPQTWKGNAFQLESMVTSAPGVELFTQTDLYSQVSRSIKYAILFIVVTFLLFFLFETRVSIRIHPFQYILVGSSLALFYLLLLSLSEHIGFFIAYLCAASMIITTLSLYSFSLLQSKSRAFIFMLLLTALYGYLYFILMLEDYALLFGSLLLFVLLASVMYVTRSVNWFSE